MRRRTLRRTCIDSTARSNQPESDSGDKQLRIVTHVGALLQPSDLQREEGFKAFEEGGGVFPLFGSLISA